MKKLSLMLVILMSLVYGTSGFPDNSEEGLTNSLILKWVGFPFDQEKLLSDPEINAIAQAITNMNEKGLLNASIRKNTLNSIVEKQRGKNNKEQYALKNLQTLLEQNPSIEASDLMASFVIMAKTGELASIDVLLEYATVSIGSTPVINNTLSMGGIGFTAPAEPAGMSEEEYFEQEKQKEADSLSLYPAAQAILSNPSVSVPLLMEAVKNREYPEFIRLRAAGFLNTMAPEVLDDDLLSSVQDQNIQAQLKCLKEGDYTWKNIVPNLCNDLQKRKEVTGLSGK
ncbi:MAG: hypothetical protein ACOX5R_20470 [bacterium]|jgi:hypothetical protein